MIQTLQILQENWWKSIQHAGWPGILTIGICAFSFGWLVSWLIRKSYRKLWSYNESLLKEQYLLNDQLRTDIRTLTAEKRKVNYELQKSSTAFTELKDVSIKYIREILQLLKNEITRTNLEKEEIFADLRTSQKNNETYLSGLRQSKEKNRELEENLRGQLSIYETEKTKWSGLHDQLKHDFQIQVGDYKQRLTALEGNYDFAVQGSSQIKHELRSSEEEKESLHQELEKSKLKAEDLNNRLQFMRDDNQTLTSLLHKTKADLEARVHELQQLQQRFSVLEDDGKESSELIRLNLSLEQEKQDFLETIDKLEAENKKYGVDLNELYHSLQLKEQEYNMLQRKFQPIQQLEQEKQQLLNNEDQLRQENESFEHHVADLQKEMEQMSLEKSLWEERYKNAEHEKEQLLKERSDNNANLNLFHENIEKNNGLIKQLEAAGRVVMSERDERKRLIVEHETTILALQQKFRNEKQYYEEHIKNLESTIAGMEEKLHGVGINTGAPGLF